MIDIDMPDNCDECRFNTEYGFCKAMPDNFCGNTDDRKRPEWCPLKEQEAVVHCKDCINRHDSINCQMYSEGMDTPDDWYCADGERKEGMNEKRYLTGRCDPLCQGCFLAKDTPLDFKDCEKCRKLFEEHPEEFKER